MALYSLQKRFDILARIDGSYFRYANRLRVARYYQLRYLREASVKDNLKALMRINLKELQVQQPLGDRDKEEYFKALAEESQKGPVFTALPMMAVQHAEDALDRKQSLALAYSLEFYLDKDTNENEQDSIDFVNENLDLVIQWLSAGKPIKQNSAFDEVVALIRESLVHAGEDALQAPPTKEDPLDPRTSEEGRKLILYQFPNGYFATLVPVGDPRKYEGTVMNNCIKSVYKYSQEVDIISIRSPSNIPRVSFSVRRSSGELLEIRGKNNQAPRAKYLPYVKEIFSSGIVKENIISHSILDHDKYEDDLSAGDYPEHLVRLSLNQSEFPDLVVKNASRGYFYAATNRNLSDEVRRNLVYQGMEAGQKIPEGMGEDIPQLRADVKSYFEDQGSLAQQIDHIPQEDDLFIGIIRELGTREEWEKEVNSKTAYRRIFALSAVPHSGLINPKNWEETAASARNPSSSTSLRKNYITRIIENDNQLSLGKIRNVVGWEKLTSKIIDGMRHGTDTKAKALITFYIGLYVGQNYYGETVPEELMQKAKEAANSCPKEDWHDVAHSASSYYAKAVAKVTPYPQILPNGRNTPGEILLNPNLKEKDVYDFVVHYKSSTKVHKVLPQYVPMLLKAVEGITQEAKDKGDLEETLRLWTRYHVYSLVIPGGIKHRAVASLSSKDWDAEEVKRTVESLFNVKYPLTLDPKKLPRGVTLKEAYVYLAAGLTSFKEDASAELLRVSLTSRSINESTIVKIMRALSLKSIAGNRDVQSSLLASAVEGHDLPLFTRVVSVFAKNGGAPGTDRARDQITKSTFNFLLAHDEPPLDMIYALFKATYALVDFPLPLKLRAPNKQPSQAEELLEFLESKPLFKQYAKYHKYDKEDLLDKREEYLQILSHTDMFTVGELGDMTLSELDRADEDREYAEYFLFLYEPFFDRYLKAFGY